jgi:hypothetical protein
MSLSIAAVIKTLKTLLIMGPWKISPNDPDPFHATITIICKKEFQIVRMSRYWQSYLFLGIILLVYLKTQNEERPHSVETSKYVPKRALFNKITLANPWTSSLSEGFFTQIHICIMSSHCALSNVLDKYLQIGYIIYKPVHFLQVL